MSRITFVTWDGAGNLPPTVAVAAELVARGHDVDMIGHRAVARSAAAAGAEFTGYPTARPWSSAEPSGPLAMVSMLGDPALGRDVVAHVRRRSSDLVIVDCVLFGAMHALRSEGIAYVAFEHLCDGYLRRAARGPLGLGLRVKGLRPLELLDGAVSRLTMTIPELDRGHGDVTHVGPAVTAAPSRAGGPAVLASLSTYAYPGMRRVWQRVLDGLDGLDARVVATTGPCVDPASLRIPANVEVHRWLDHGEVFPEMTAVIGHGGHGTAVAALAHGVPLLALPLDTRGDQPFVATSVEVLGAGRRLSKQAKPAAIRAAVEALLADGPHRDAASRLAQVIRRADGRRGSADLIEALLSGTSAEVQRSR